MNVMLSNDSDFEDNIVMKTKKRKLQKCKNCNKPKRQKVKHKQKLLNKREDKINAFNKKLDNFKIDKKN